MTPLPPNCELPSYIYWEEINLQKKMKSTRRSRRKSRVERQEAPRISFGPQIQSHLELAAPPSLPVMDINKFTFLFKLL